MLSTRRCFLKVLRINNKFGGFRISVKDIYRYLSIGRRGFVVPPAPLTCFYRLPLVPLPTSPAIYSFASTSTAVALPKMTDQPFVRLPKTVTPRHYKLYLKPNLETLLFTGKVSIDVNVNSAGCKEIILNAVQLNISNVLFLGTNGTLIKPENVSISNELSTATFSFADDLPVGPAVFSMSFDGDINDNMVGLYRSKYTSVSGEERYAAVTQFESTGARRCFPCWDEPALKASFDISVACPKDRVCLSNMPEEKVVEEDGLKVLHFAKTPIMSTYLVAVVVGEYDYIEDTSSDGVRVRVYTPVGKTEQGKFALDVATRVLPYYKEYFNISYPLPKIDLITITNFSAGAMENWGLVTYRETCLLVDPENSSAVSKQWIALVVGHELAHQWFGNLVTMEWWTHLWLNEGYASFVEFLCVEHLFPEYNIWTQFVKETHSRALELDGLRSTHPIEVPVGHPAEIDEIFDDISYNKGAAIIRMLHRYIGDDDFRKGMNIYLNRHKYSNTFTEDLWAALEEASNKPVGAVMSTWTKQKGYPVVRVSVKNSSSPAVLTLRQQIFSSDGKATDPTLWMVPIIVATAESKGEETVVTVLETASSEITVNVTSPNSWIKLNPGTVGFYRTQYSPDLLARFYPAIQDKTLPPLDRLGLLDDLFALVQAGETPTVEVLKVLDAYKEEDNYNVWSAINSSLSKLSILLSHTDLEDAWRGYIKKLFLKIYLQLGWEPSPNESHLTTLLRSLVISRLASCGEESVIAEAMKRFADHCSGKETIPADLRNAVYRAVMTQGDPANYDALLQLYRKTDLHEERDRICRNLGAIRDKAILQKVLEFALSDEVRSQDSVFVIISVSGFTKIGRELAWEFFKKNCNLFRERYEGGFLLTRLVKDTTEYFASEERAQEVEAFFKENPFPGRERTIQQSLETIRLNEAWLKRDLASIKAFLEAQC